MKISANTILALLFALLLGAAVFFTVKVEQFRHTLNASAADAAFPSGSKAMVVQVIDGDEIAVKMGESRFVVRLLGIRSYESGVNDPVMENIARESLRYLETRLLHREVSLVFEEFKRDSNKRVLAYVYVDGADAGLEMVDRGLTIVFTRYPFPRMEEYLAAERKAMKAKNGLWGIRAAAERSIQLKNLWDSERGG